MDLCFNFQHFAMLVGGGLQGGGLQVYVSDLGMTKYNVFFVSNVYETRRA